MDPKLKTYLDERFDAVDERFESLENNLGEQIQSVANTATKILTKLEGRIDELDDIVSDTGLGGRVHKLEIELKEIKTRVA